MANTKMLIDASHREETRVVVVRGTRIEEFDFEAQERRQLRGNIYLAKVTRVEPSLQAAFIDYGGNRHGFLAFSEIHPDYYQIPAADRQALLDAEEEAATAEDEENGISEAKDVQDTDEANDESGDEAPADEAPGEVTNDDDVQNGEQDGEDEAEPAKKPRRKSRRTSRRKTKSDEESVPEETADKVNSDEESDDAPSDENEAGEEDGDEDGGPGRTMAAMMDIDSISEPADEPGDEQDSAESTDEEDAKPAKKPRAKRKTARKPAAKKTKKPDDDAETGETAEETSAKEADEGAEEKPAPKKRARRKKTEKEETAAATASDEVVGENAVEASEESDDEQSDGEEKTAKPKRARRGPARKRHSKKDAASRSDDDGNGEEDDQVESVGQEDALEEATVRRPRRQYKIQEVIRRRQVMLVQVVKEERGNKGAALTTYLSLAGRYSVLMPNTARGGGISRKISNPGDRKRLKEIANALEVPKGMGVILRTAGASQDEAEIRRDFDYLMRLWENVRNLTLESSAPFLVYEEGSLIKRSIRDLYNKNVGEIIVAGEEGFKEAKDFMNMLMPDQVKSVKRYNGSQPLLAKFNIEGQLDNMLNSQVTLKSGGYLIINQTEALVAIDVNSGRSTREHSIEATALQTNLEASDEIARQVRLRDLAGLIVIDFIDMEEKRNNRAVERKLKECLKGDRARIQVGHISHFGLLEMSRQRMRASVLESTMAVCPVCSGTGMVRSDSSLALHILRAIDEHLTRNSRFDVNVKTAPAVAVNILNSKRQAVSDLEDRFGVQIQFVFDHDIVGQDFVIEKGEASVKRPRQQNVVNPMDGGDEVAEDTDENQDVEVSDQDEQDNKRGKRRRGRGRGRNRNRADQNEDRGESSDADKAAASEPKADMDKAVEQEKPVDADAADEKPAKNTRGRKKRSETVADSGDDAARSSSPSDDATETTAEPAESARQRKTGRPGKKKRVETPAEISTGTTQASSEAESNKTDSESDDKTGAPPRKVNRRNTRRVAKSEQNEQEKPESGWDGFLS